MDRFGWNYPAGAENDPSAPYNQTPERHDDECPACGWFTWENGKCSRCEHEEED